MELYKKVSTFDELLKLNIDFINGVITSTPYHSEPYKIESNESTDLIETNRLGFLTLGGQCAEDTPTHEKRLFLDGYIHQDLVRNFVKYLKNFKKIEYYIEFLSSKQIKTNIRNWKNAPNNGGIYYNSLSRSKQGEEWKDDMVLPFQDLTYITSKYWNNYPNIIKILSNYAFVHIQHRSFHNLNNDLYTVINGYLKSDQSSYKPKKQKNNAFGVYNYQLHQLQSDLKKLQLNSFGTKKKKESLNTKKKPTLYTSTKNHLKRNKVKYLVGATNAIALSLLKNKVSNALNKSQRIKRQEKKEQRLRKIIQEELSRSNSK